MIASKNVAGGRHRKAVPVSQTAKGRVALVAAAASTATAGGIGGAAAASLQAGADHPTVDVTLANDTETLSADSLDAAASIPQILEIAEYKPTSGLQEQLDKAVAAFDERNAEAAHIAASQAAAALAGVQSVIDAFGKTIVQPALGTLTSGFGMRWGVLHAGIDIAAPIGTPILAVMDGTVIDSGPAAGFGNWIRIQHDDGTISVYGHMSSLNVGVGERVSAGQTIAGMGSEGFSTGSHLHLEIHPNGGGPVDPLAWFAERGLNI